MLSSPQAAGSCVANDDVVVSGLNERVFVTLFRLVVTRKGLRVNRCAYGVAKPLRFANVCGVFVYVGIK